jgi:ubiquinone biosynthesis O-methyltransferase
MHSFAKMQTCCSRSLVARRSGQALGNGLRLLASVSSTEVEKFSGMDETWWDARKNPLLPMNAVRIRYIGDQLARNQQQLQTTHLVSPLEGKTVLDIGCGGGLLSESLARLGATVTAIDPSQRLVDAARLHGQLDRRTRNINYLGNTTAEDLSQTGDKFDVVCLLEVIEHATDPDSLVEAAASMVKSGGYLFLSTLNKTIKSYLLTIVGAEYIMGYTPPGTHDWKQYLSPAQVGEMTSRNGLRPVDVSGMVLHQPPMFGKWDWRLDSTNVEVNWIATYEKEN